MTKGYEPKTKYISPVLCEYTYPEEAAKFAKTFFLGNAQVNVQKFLYCRYALKQKTKKLHSIREKTVTEEHFDEYAELDGQKYWFISDTGIVHEAIFRLTKKHVSRKEDGNYYPTEELAKLGSMHKK